MDAALLKLEFRLKSFQEFIQNLKPYKIMDGFTNTNPFYKHISDFNNDFVNMKDCFEKVKVCKAFLSEIYSGIDFYKTNGYEDGVILYGLELASMLEKNADIKSSIQEKATPIKAINIFNSQPISEVREHFKTLTILKSKANNIPIITPEQLEEFLKQAFEGKEGEKIPMNKGSKDGKQIQKVFLSYYHNFAHIYPRPNNKQEEYLKLLTNYFSGWNFDRLKANFHNANK